MDRNQYSSLTDGYHSLQWDGIEQRYFVSGAPQGPICVVHSGGPGIAWEYLRMPEVDRWLRTVYIEPIGTGTSGRLKTHPNGYDVERYADFLHGLILHLDQPEVYLLGHSHGGFVAQIFALAHPDRLSGLILYDTAPAAGAELFTEATHRLEAFRFLNNGRPEVETVLRTWYALGGIADDSAFRSALHQLFPAYFADYWRRENEFQHIRDNLSGSYVTSSKTFDNSDEVASIIVPTLILVGRQDFICGPRWALALQKSIKESQLVEFVRAAILRTSRKRKNFRIP